MSQNHSNNTFLDLREEDNLSIVDKMTGPKVSFIQRHSQLAGILIINNTSVGLSRIPTVTVFVGQESWRELMVYPT